MENEVLITGMFLGAGLLASVVIPGLLVMWDRVHDHLGRTGEVKTSPGFLTLPAPKSENPEIAGQDPELV